MIDFILKYKKNIELKTHINAIEFRQELLTKINQDIKNAYIQEIHTQKTFIFFKAPVGRFSWNGWNIFNPVTSGKFKVDIKKQIPSIYIELEFKEFFAIAFFMSFTAITPFLLGFPIIAVALLAFDWIIFYAGTRLITALRIKSYIEKIRKKINDPTIKFIPYSELFNEDINFVNQVLKKNNRDVLG